MTPIRFSILSSLLTVFLFSEGIGKVDFTRDVRPILSEACFQCHGPDKKARKAKLRLDTLAGATADLGGYQALVPGKPGESEMIARLITSDEDDKMPPAKSGKKLSAEQIETLRQWVSEDGKYQQHWTYRPIAKATPPQLKHGDFVKNEVDRFVLAGIVDSGRKPQRTSSP